MKLLLTCMIGLSSWVTFAETIQIERTLKDSTTMVALDLNPKTVFCTARGYGTVQLKISVPDLDWLAHFDHRVVGETLPCITGGACSDESNPGNIIDPNEKITLAPMRVLLLETLSIDKDKQTCQRLLTEEIKSTIRNRPFYHIKTGKWEPADIEACLKLTNH